MNGLTFNPKNPRVKKAKIARRFDKAVVRKLLWLVVLAILGGWIWLVFFQHQTAAHLLLIVVGALVSMLFWYYGELCDLKPAESIDSVQDIASVLDRRMLARLRPNASPYDLAMLVAKRPGGYFYATRFGVGPDFLQNLSSKETVTTSLVWQAALELSNEVGSDHISSAAVVAGLVLAIPGHDTELAQLKIDSHDIAEGLRWYVHVDSVFKRAAEHRSFGGLGRDLSFGWAPMLNQVVQ